MMNRTMKTTYWKKFTLLWAGLLCLLLILCACDTSRTEEQSSALTDTEDCEGTAAETAAETRPLPDGDTAEEEKGSENATAPAESEPAADTDTEEPTETDPGKDPETDPEQATAPEDGEATTEKPEIELPKVDFD